MEVATNNYLLPWITENGHPNMEKYLDKGRHVKYKAGDFISLQGEIERNIVYLTKGKVKVAGLSEEGNQKTFWYNTAPTIVGESSFFDEQFSNASIVVCEDCEGYLFKGSDFLSLLKNDTQLHTQVTKSVALKIRILISQIFEISHAKPDKHVCRLLYNYAKTYGIYKEEGVLIDLNLSHKEIGAICALHRTTVAKIFIDLKNKQIISSDENNNIIILNLNELYKRTV